MIDVITFLAPPFAACLVLVGILGYFGIHVLRREVIFVDLALADKTTAAVISVVAANASGIASGGPRVAAAPSLPVILA